MPECVSSGRDFNASQRVRAVNSLREQRAAAISYALKPIV